MSYDLIIIGSGFAGLSVAQRAYEKGLNFAIVSDGFGASQHFSGAFDLIDPRWRSPNLDIPNYPHLSSAFDDFVAAHPGHLYDEAGASASEIIEAMRAFFSFYNIPVCGDGSEYIFTLNSNGKVKPTAFALDSFGLASQDFKKKTVFVDLPMVPQYLSPLITNNLMVNFPDLSVVKCTGFVPNRTSPLVSLWQMFEQDEFQQKFLTFLKENKSDVMIVPPVWKNMSHAELEQELGVRIVEMLSVLPSMAGERMKKIVNSALNDKNIKYIKGRVSNFEASGDKINSITVEGIEGPLVADRIVLATGKFIGGGMERKNKILKESLFSLPLYSFGQAVGAAVNMEDLISQNPDSKQAIMNVGVSIKPSLQNLSVCGHVLSGFDFSRERNGFGTSVASSIRATIQ